MAKASVNSLMPTLRSNRRIHDSTIDRPTIDIPNHDTNANMNDNIKQHSFNQYRQYSDQRSQSSMSGRNTTNIRPYSDNGRGIVRPLSPPDNTPITINGRSVNRKKYQLGTIRRKPISLRITDMNPSNDGVVSLAPLNIELEKSKQTISTHVDLPSNITSNRSSRENDRMVQHIPHSTRDIVITSIRDDKIMPNIGIKLPIQSNDIDNISSNSNLPQISTENLPSINIIRTEPEQSGRSVINPDPYIIDSNQSVRNGPLSLPSRSLKRSPNRHDRTGDLPGIMTLSTSLYHLQHSRESSIDGPLSRSDSNPSDNLVEDQMMNHTEGPLSYSDRNPEGRQPSPILRTILSPSRSLDLATDNGPLSRLFGRSLRDLEGSGRDPEGTINVGQSTKTTSTVVSPTRNVLVPQLLNTPPYGGGINQPNLIIQSPERPKMAMHQSIKLPHNSYSSPSKNTNSGHTSSTSYPHIEHRHTSIRQNIPIYPDNVIGSDNKREFVSPIFNEQSKPFGHQLTSQNRRGRSQRMRQNGPPSHQTITNNNENMIDHRSYPHHQEPYYNKPDIRQRGHSDSYRDNQQFINQQTGHQPVFIPLTNYPQSVSNHQYVQNNDRFYTSRSYNEQNPQSDMSQTPTQYKYDHGTTPRQPIFIPLVAPNMFYEQQYNGINNLGHLSTPSPYYNQMQSNRHVSGSYSPKNTVIRDGFDKNSVNTTDNSQSGDPSSANPNIESDVQNGVINESIYAAKLKGKTIVVQPPNSGNMPDYDNMSDVDKARFRAHFQVMFGRMRDSNPQYNITDVRDKSLPEIHAYYEAYYYHFSIKSTVQYYMLFVTATWLGIELLFTKALGLNFGGFALNQLKLAGTYERYMFEFVEKYSGVGAGFSPEVKILGLTVLSAVIYLALKTFGKWIGSGWAGTIQGYINRFLNGEMTPAAAGNISQHLNNLEDSGQNTSTQSTVPNISSIPNIPDANGVNIGGFNLSSLLPTAASLVAGFANNSSSGGGSSTNNPPPRRDRRRRRRPQYRN